MHISKSEQGRAVLWGDIGRHSMTAFLFAFYCIFGTSHVYTSYLQSICQKSIGSLFGCRLLSKLHNSTLKFVIRIRE